MALTIAASTTGTAQLAQVVLTIPALPSKPFAGCVVEVLNGSTSVATTGTRLRTRHLLSPAATASRNYRAAWRDLNGVWSDWSATKALACGNFSAGATAPAIGSGVFSDEAIEEPGLRWPDLAAGSGQGRSWMTNVTENAFPDEVRRGKWPVDQGSINVSVHRMDASQALCLHRFYRACNGPLKAFDFEFDDPVTGGSRRGFYRFADASLSDTTPVLDYADASFSLVQILAEADGA